MSNHLRVTPAEYESLCRACRTICSSGSYAAFQKKLADALRLIDPEFARRISRLGKPRVRVLRMHLEGRPGNPKREAVSARIDLSIREWQAVSRACALIWLSDDCPRSFQGRLVGEVEEAEPALAAKLGRLDAGQAATLYRRVKSGKRWSA